MRNIIILSLSLWVAVSHGIASDLVQYDLKGHIGKSPVTAHLNVVGPKFSGSYQYDKVKKDIPYQGELQADGSLSMKEFADLLNQSGVFIGKWDASKVSYSGHWENPAGTKKFDFEMTGQKTVVAESTEKNPEKESDSRISSHKAELCGGDGQGATTVEYSSIQLSSAELTKKINSEIEAKVFSGIDRKSTDMSACNKSDSHESTEVFAELKDIGWDILRLEKTTSYESARVSVSSEVYYFSSKTGQEYTLKSFLSSAGVKKVNAMIEKKIAKEKEEEDTGKPCKTNFVTIEKIGTPLFSKTGLEVSFARDALEGHCGFVDLSVKIPMADLKPALAADSPFGH